MCDLKYIGKFCKNPGGGTVLGFVCIKNGIPTISYYDPITGIPYTGDVDENCSSPFSVYSKTVNNISGTTITDALFANIKQDLVTNKYLVIIVVNGFVLQEGAVSSGFSLSGNTITVTDAITVGDVVSIQFIY